MKKVTDFLSKAIIYYNEDIQSLVKKKAEFSANGRPLSIGELKANRANTKDLLYFLQSSKADLLKENAVYTGFFFLSTVIEHVSLSAYEKLDLIMNVIEKNHYVFEKRKETNPVLIDIDRLKEMLYPNMSRTKFREFLKNTDISKILKAPDDTLSEEELFLKEKIFEVFEQTTEAQNHIINCHRLVKEHYINKVDSYTEKDIKFVRLALLEMDISPNLVGTITRILKKELEKRKRKNVPLSKQKESDYDYKTMSEEVECFIDLNTMDPKRSLTKEEEIQVLTILTRMGIDREQRRLLLRKNEMLVGSKHPFTKYLENYKKLRYYEAKVGIQKDLNDMEEYFQSLFLTDDDTYICSREFLTETLKKVNSILPKNFEYEEYEANTRLSK